MHSSPRWRRALVGSLASAALVATVLAGSSSALVTETDTVNLDGEGVDFTGVGIDFPETPNIPLRVPLGGDAIVRWDEQWFEVVPKVSGVIAFEDFGTNCARIRVQLLQRRGRRGRR